MDINLIRGIVTAASLAIFLAIVWWAWSPRRKASLEAIGRSVLDDDAKGER